MTYFLRIALPFLPRMQFEQRTRHIKPAMRYSSVFFASIVAGSLFRSFEVRRSLLHHKLAILGVDDAEDLLFLARLGADVDDVFFLAAGSLKLIAKPFGLGRNGMSASARSSTVRFVESMLSASSIVMSASAKSRSTWLNR